MKDGEMSRFGFLFLCTWRVDNSVISGFQDHYQGLEPAKGKVSADLRADALPTVPLKSLGYGQTSLENSSLVGVRLSLFFLQTPSGLERRNKTEELFHPALKIHVPPAYTEVFTLRPPEGRM
ncbi:hypothetical protein PoB_000226400 [Plakobranchus ocellatus]|uniref:Uncharacterized protein n=1 Tax=Plakobranchus ocellatus TaxID=259542 RepID=A0AAV3Y1B4_9GAST|nr:hypothetical protein PoB_000226400 [Plakobranchus ocellatus]